MAYKNLTAEEASKLAQTLGPEFTAAAKNDLINFADAILEAFGLYAAAAVKVPEVNTFAAKQNELKVEEPKAKTPAKGKGV